MDRGKKNTRLLFNQTVTHNMSKLNEIMPRDIYLNKTIEIAHMKEKILRLKTMNEMIHKRDTNVCKKNKRKWFRKLIQKIRHFVCWWTILAVYKWLFLAFFKIYPSNSVIQPDHLYFLYKQFPDSVCLNIRYSIIFSIEIQGLCNRGIRIFHVPNSKVSTDSILIHWPYHTY